LKKLEGREGIPALFFSRSPNPLDLME